MCGAHRIAAMQDPDDKLTLDAFPLESTTSKRGRGRPATGEAKTTAERMKEYRARLRATGAASAREAEAKARITALEAENKKLRAEVERLRTQIERADLPLAAELRYLKATGEVKCNGYVIGRFDGLTYTPILAKSAAYHREAERIIRLRIASR